MKRLRFVMTTAPRVSQKFKRTPDALVSFAPMDALADGLGGLSELETKTFSEVAGGSYNYFENGDVLLAKVTPCFENGKKAIARELENGAGFATSEVLVFRPDSDGIDTRYLRYLFCSEDFRHKAIASMTGAGGLRRVSERAVLDFPLRITDLATQRQIADFLDRETARIDLLIEKKQRLVVLLGDKVLAQRQLDIDDLFNIFGPSRLKNFTLSITTGPFGSAIKQDEYVEGGTPILNPAHIGDGKITPDTSVTLSDDKFRELQYWRLEPGDVLMGRRGELGRSAVVDENLGDSICGTGCLRLRVRPKHKSSYIHLIVSSRRSREWLDLNAVGTTMKNLNEAIVGRLPIPNVKREQQDKFVSDIQNAHRRNAEVRSKIMASIDRLKEYRSALITAAVTGQIEARTYAKAGTSDRSLDAIQEEMGA